MRPVNVVRDLTIVAAYARGGTMEEVGDRFGLSPQRVQQIIARSREHTDDERLWRRARPRV